MEKGLRGHEVLEEENNNIKLLGRGLRPEPFMSPPEEGLVKLVRFTIMQISIDTMANRCLVTQA